MHHSNHLTNNGGWEGNAAGIASTCKTQHLTQYYFVLGKESSDIQPMMASSYRVVYSKQAQQQERDYFNLQERWFTPRSLSGANITDGYILQPYIYPESRTKDDYFISKGGGGARLSSPHKRHKSQNSITVGTYYDSNSCTH